MIQYQSEKADSIQQIIAILHRSLDKLDHHDYASAHIMVGVAQQMLSEVHLGLDHRLHVQRYLSELIEH